MFGAGFKPLSVIFSHGNPLRSTHCPNLLKYMVIHEEGRFVNPDKICYKWHQDQCKSSGQCILMWPYHGNTSWTCPWKTFAPLGDHQIEQWHSHSPYRCNINHPISTQLFCVKTNKMQRKVALMRFMGHPSPTPTNTHTYRHSFISANGPWTFN